MGCYAIVLVPKEVADIKGKISELLAPYDNALNTGEKDFCKCIVDRSLKVAEENINKLYGYNASYALWVSGDKTG